MNPIDDRGGALFRQLTPLVLLGTALVALLGPWLPGAAWVAEHIGPTVLLGCCVFLLTLYVLLLWGETLRLHALLTAVLKELIEFRNRRAAEVQQGRPLAQRLEAVKLLLPALESGDATIRQTSRRNLTLLVGKDLGEGAEPWRRWVAEQEAGGAAGAN